VEVTGDLAPGAQRAAGQRQRRTMLVPALAVLAGGIPLFGFLFAEEATAAIRIWQSSTAYNHCWLVLPVAAWLAWTRRHRLVGLSPAPSALLALLALPAGLAWLLAERLGIMEGRQLAALALLEILVLAVLGWRICRAMAAPLAYLVFLVPFGAFATPALQNATAWMIDVGLDLFDVTHYRDGLLIETPEGLFHVAEACAGLRFVIAALAFGALYAFVMFRSPARRLVVMVLALVVPVLANGLRALGIVLLGHYLGSADAAAADHVIYGWGFFSAVILLLILAGLPFRQDDASELPPETAPEPPRHGTALPGAAVLALALTAAGPVLATALDRAGGGVAPDAVAARLIAPDGCQAVADGAALRCSGATVTAQLLAFPSRVTWGPVAAAQHRLAAMAGADDEDVTFSIAVPGSATWSGRQWDQGTAALAVTTWLDGAPMRGGLRSRILQAWNSLVGGGRGGPVVAAVTVRVDAPAAGAPMRGRTVLEAVLEAQTEKGLAAQAAALSRRH